MTTYARPASYFAIEPLRDGRKIAIRAINHDDKPILQEVWHRMSRRSQYLRFFISKDELSDKEADFFSDIDFFKHVGLLASIITDSGQVPAGVGRFIMPAEQKSNLSAELAFTVVDEFQGLGIATLLLKHLVSIAKAEGISELTALVLPENAAMLSVFRKSGLPVKQFVNDGGVVEITLSLADANGPQRDN
jgi:GNAT superfamily N-acetyltransferase